MSDNAADPSVTGSNAAGSVNASTGTSAVTADLKNEIQKVVAGMMREMVPRMVSKTIQESIPQALQSALGDVLPKPANQQDQAQPHADGGTEGKLSLKALHEQIQNLTKGIEAERKRADEAQRRAIETQTRAQVQAQFAKHLGADSPHLTPYVNHYLSQFEYKDGIVVRKVTGEYGDEQFLPADKAVEELFKSDLKHLVQQSKAPNLPPSGYRQAQGNPFQQQQANGKQPQINPILGGIAEGLAKDRPEFAQALYQMAVNPEGQK